MNIHDLDPFVCLQGLCMILEAAAAEGSIILEPQLDTILNTMHAQVSFLSSGNYYRKAGSIVNN